MRREKGKEILKRKKITLVQGSSKKAVSFSSILEIAQNYLRVFYTRYIGWVALTLCLRLKISPSLSLNFSIKTMS
jgi:hypothetical protein